MPERVARFRREAQVLAALNHPHIAAIYGLFTLWSLSLGDEKAAPYGGVQSTRQPDATFSPDGRWVAYTSSTTLMDGSANFVQPFPSTGATYQAPGGSNPVWSRVGTELYYSTIGENTRGRGVVSFKAEPSPALGNSTPISGEGVLSLSSRFPRNFDIAPDGKRLLVVVDASGATPSSRQEIHVVLNWFEELKARVPAEP